VTDRAQMLAEAYRRGLLPPAQKAAYEEAMRRGIVGKKPNAATDVVRSAGAGLASAVSGLAGQQGDIAQMRRRMAPMADNPLSRAIAVGTSAFDKIVYGPTSEPLRKASGGDYQPQTRAGRYAKTIGEFAPNALMSPGGAVKGVARNVLARGAQVIVPAVASEGAGQAVEAMGGNETAQTVARVGGAVAGGAATGVRIRPRGAKVKPITPDQVRQNRDAAYRAVDDAGVRYKPGPFNGLVKTMRQEMDAAEMDPDLHKRVASTLRAIEKRAGQSPSLGELDKMRRLVRQRVMDVGDADEQRLGKILLRTIDDFIDTAKPKHVQAGDPQAAAGMIRNARNLHQRASKIEAVEEGVEKAMNRTGPSGSGGNINNNLRSQMRQVLESETNLTPAERAALERIVRGTRTQNALRQVGKLSPSGNGLNLALHMGALVPSGGLSAVAGGVGLAAKAAADRSTQRQVQQVIQLIARGGQESVAAQRSLLQMARDPAVARIIQGMLASAPGVAVSVPANAQER
jgi:hypothetical protein